MNDVGSKSQKIEKEPQSRPRSSSSHPRPNQDPSGDDDSSADEATHPSKKKPKKKKGAPEEISSKRRPSSFRKIVQPTRREGRDPRFDPRVVGDAAPTGAAKAALERNYAFLDDLRRAEMDDLKARLRLAKKRRAPDREALERELMSLQSRDKARAQKKLEEKVLDEHRAREKELVKEGKKPFYLKKSEQKSRLLVERFKGMKKRQVDKAIERRRKKDAAKEKKELDHLARRR